MRILRCDLTALAFHLGYWPSVLIFGALICVPALGWRRLGWNPTVSFWLAYVLTRPLGASFADGFSKPGNGGLGVGDGVISLVSLAVFVGLVAYAHRNRADVRVPGELSAHRVPTGASRLVWDSE